MIDAGEESESILGSYYGLRGIAGFHDNQPEQALKDLDAALAGATLGHERALFHHYRARVLRALNRPAEAAVELITASARCNPVHDKARRAVIESEWNELARSEGFPAARHDTEEAPDRRRQRHAVEILERLTGDLGFMYGYRGASRFEAAGWQSHGAVEQMSLAGPAVFSSYGTRLRRRDSEDEPLPFQLDVELYLKPYPAPVAITAADAIAGNRAAWAVHPRLPGLTTAAVVFPSGMTLVMRLLCHDEAAAAEARASVEEAVLRLG